MRIRSLELRDFRNYERFDLDPGRGLTVLVGPNAVGKTNIIEAVQATTTTDSFRGPRWEEVVRRGAREASVRILAEGRRSRAEIRMTVTASGRRSFEVNSTKKRRSSDVIGVVPCVVFAPDDLAMVKGSAEKRRDALDAIGRQLWSVYDDTRRDYTKVVRQRNRLLKEESAGRAALAPWDEQLVRTGARLTAYRARLLSAMSERIEGIHAGLADGERLQVSYEDRIGLDEGRWETRLTVDEAAEVMSSRLEERRADEQARRVTVVGPHRDDVSFTVQGADVRAYASQGQQRTVALSWKLAELDMVRETSNRTPVLLLDDVMSELDERRRRSLLVAVEDDVQTWVTTTNLGYFGEETIEAAKVVSL